VKALKVHGGGAVFDRTSCSVGLRGQYGPVGIDKLNGLEGKNSPEDMNPSSSASQSSRADEQRGDFSPDAILLCSDGGFRFFDLRIAVRRYFMGTRGGGPPSFPTPNSCSSRLPSIAVPNWGALDFAESG
jgi:hypothetical protein